MDNKILGREPVLWTTLFAVVLQLGTAFGLALSDEHQALLNGAFAVVLGAVAAAVVSAERVVPLLVGVLQAVIQVAVGFGLELSPEHQTTLLAAAATLVAFWTRGQVVSPVPPAATLRTGVQPSVGHLVGGGPVSSGQTYRVGPEAPHVVGERDGQ